MVCEACLRVYRRGYQNFTQSRQPLHQRFGIRVMAVCPGIVDTAIVPQHAEWLAPALAAVKILQPADIAKAVQAMIENDSPEAYYVTVQNEPAGS